jgi:hypothetical protein
MTETGLQGMLDDEVFGRAYGLALPAAIAGIAAGSLIAPVLVSAFGATAALLTSGGVVVAYCSVACRSPQATPSTAIPQPLGHPAGPPPVWQPIGEPTRGRDHVAHASFTAIEAGVNAISNNA